jgi:hypothetical protein
MESNTQYLLRRSREEEDAAARAADAKTRELHLEMSVRYRDAAEGRLPPPAPDIPAPHPLLPDEFRIFE